jgi:Fe-S cluster assembly protein SufD
VVFVNGMIVPSLSRLDALGAGATIRSLAVDLGAGDSVAAGRFGRSFDPGVHGFAALNTAFADDGAVVRITRGQAPAGTLHIVNCTSVAGSAPSVSHLRNLIVCESGSVLTVVEHHLGGPGTHLTNAATEVFVETGAMLRHVRIQDEGAGAYHVGRVEVDVGENATYESHVVTLGASLSRTEIRAKLLGRHAECRLSGLYVLDGERHGDHHTWIDHGVAETKSFETYKGVIDDDARGVFTGHVLVRRDAQHIEARQTNKNLLLSDGAVAETRPQLEIYADDVQCSHGATIGRLDESAVFYLRQRGLDLEGARALLTWAFAGEVLQSLPDAAVRVRVSERVRERIAGAAHVAATLEGA